MGNLSWVSNSFVSVSRAKSSKNLNNSAHSMHFPCHAKIATNGKCRRQNAHWFELRNIDRRTKCEKEKVSVRRKLTIFWCERVKYYYRCQHATMCKTKWNELFQSSIFRIIIIIDCILESKEKEKKKGEANRTLTSLFLLLHQIPFA